MSRTLWGVLYLYKNYIGMEYQKNDVLEWRHPENEDRKRDLMIVDEVLSESHELKVRIVNGPDGVARSLKVPVFGVEFLGRCSEYEPVSDVIARYRK